MQPVRIAVEIPMRDAWRMLHSIVGSPLGKGGFCL